MDSKDYQDLIAFLSKKFDSFDNSLDTLRKETNDGFADIRQEFGKEFQDIRQEFGKEFQDIRQEFGKEFQDIRQEFGKEFQDVRAEIQDVRKELSDTRAELKEDNACNLRQMGVLIEAQGHKIDIVIEGQQDIRRALTTLRDDHERLAEKTETLDLGHLAHVNDTKAHSAGQ